jgi:glyoxylase-like metal-dependent hydrolase (beta-lactamase superfamily II)
LKIGKYELIPVETGRFALDGGAMFGVVPKNLWEKTNPADDQNRITLALRSLLLKSEERRILIDTGIGTKIDEKFSKIYQVDLEDSNLKKNLSKHHVDPEEITDVILTHLHFDHAGGTTYLEDNQLKPTFPNAVHHLQGEHWDWALQPSEKDRASFLIDDYLLLEENNLLNKLTGSGELFPGLEALVMFGHTPGMQVVKISDSNQTLLFCADLIPTASHIPIPWVMAYDNNPMITMNEKNKILSLAVKENWILFFEHDPYRTAATVTQTKKGYKSDQEVSLID